MIVHSFPIQQQLATKSAQVSKSINITHAGSKVKVHMNNNHGSKSCLKVKLLQGSPPQW